MFINLGDTINNQAGTALTLGSEFKPVNLLQQVFVQHPLWPCMSAALSVGVQFPLDDLSSHLQQRGVEEGLAFGNHRGTERYGPFFEDCLIDDMKRGYSLVIPRDAVLRIPNALIAPINDHKQNTINVHRGIINKKRLTHNQSMTYDRGSGTSVNNRVLWEELQECRYGYCLLHAIHKITCLQQRHPWSRILLTKYDFKLVYWRLHYH